MSNFAGSQNYSKENLMRTDEDIKNSYKGRSVSITLRFDRSFHLIARLKKNIERISTKIYLSRIY